MCFNIRVDWVKPIMVFSEMLTVVISNSQFTQSGRVILDDLKMLHIVDGDISLESRCSFFEAL